MTWALAAPFISACRDAVLGGNPFAIGASEAADSSGTGAGFKCSAACAQALAPFNAQCFASVLADDFFQYGSGVTVPEAQQSSALYAACFPPDGTELSAAVGSAAGGGAAALAAAAAALLLLVI